MTIWAAVVLLGVAVAPPTQFPTMLVDSGACLARLMDAHGGLRGDATPLWPTPAVATDPGVIAETLTHPSFGPPQLLSLHRRKRGGYFLAVTTDGVTSRRDLDVATARLMASLWKGLVGRAQVVVEGGYTPGAFDDPDNAFWSEGAAGRVHAPLHDSVLGKTITAVDHLVYLVTHPKAGDEGALPDIRALMQDALERTERGEPCLRLSASVGDVAR